MRIVVLFTVFWFLGQPAFAGLRENFEKDLKAETEALDSFYDEGVDYSRFTGRVTDRDPSANVLKISSEMQNVKFFRSGDELRFKVAAGGGGRNCFANVRGVEEGYLVIYVRDIKPCWGEDEYFRRGTMLVFESEALGKRVYDAAMFRLVLIKRRKDFYSQLNNTNHFIWSFDQERIKTAAEYDKKIIELQKAKERALEMMLSKKKDSISMQQELVYRLDALDKDLEYYRIEKDEPLYDRWHLDHDLGLPVARRPGRTKIVTP
jgi:hypothetical protein